MRIRHLLKRETKKLEKARQERMAAQQANFVEIVSNASISQENEQGQVPRLDAARHEGEGHNEAEGGSTKAVAQRG